MYTVTRSKSTAFCTEVSGTSSLKAKYGIARIVTRSKRTVFHMVFCLVWYVQVLNIEKIYETASILIEVT
jgi:hypothetical protein